MFKAALTVVSALLVVIIALTLMLAVEMSDSLPGGGGSGSICTGDVTAPLTPSPTHSPVQTCLSGGRIATAASQIASHLSGNPDVWYGASMPPLVLDYWERVCPTGSSCWPYWQSGNLQCVQLVTGAFALAGMPLPAVGNAIDFWALYRQRTGWQEIAVGAPGPLAAGLPQPGDIMVWASPPPGVGHVAIVLSVLLPDITGKMGAVTFAEANGPGAIVTQHVLPDRQVLTWPGYTVYGYIRAL